MRKITAFESVGEEGDSLEDEDAPGKRCQAESAVDGVLIEIQPGTAQGNLKGCFGVVDEDLGAGRRGRWLEKPMAS